MGDPAHVVDDLVDVVVAAPSAWGPMAATAEAVASTIGDAPELLDVHVEQLTRALPDTTVSWIPTTEPERLSSVNNVFVNHSYGSRGSRRPGPVAVLRALDGRPRTPISCYV